MFALWYGTLVYKEYRDALWNKFTKKQPPRETAIISPSRIPIADTKISRSPSPQPPKSPQTPIEPMSSPKAHSTPNKVSEPSMPLEPPMKPPRAPSPHPIRSEAFEEIEYEDEEEEDEGSTDVDEEEEEEEEEEENSVISTPPKVNANSVNER